MEFGAPNMPKQDLEVSQKTNVTGQIRYAGFWIRLLAYIIDIIILGIVSRILFGADTANVSGGEAFVDFDIWGILIGGLYMILFWKYFGATPGKMALGLRVVREDGKFLEWREAILRWVGYFPSALVLGLGFIWMGFDPKKQGWHDKIAKTIVIKK